MKKAFMFILLAACFGLHAHAETVGDTLVIEKVDKVKIETRDTVQRIVITGAKDNPTFHYTQRIAISDPGAVRKETKSVKDFGKILNSENKKSVFEPHLTFGLGTMLDAPKGYDFKLWPSFELGFQVVYGYRPYGPKNQWNIGLGINWRKYSMSSDTYWVKDNGVMRLEPYVDGQSDRTTSLHQFSLQVPIYYTHSFDKDKNWQIMVGGIVNINTGSHVTREFEFENEDYQVETGKIGQRPITIDAFLAVNVPVLGRIYCKYCPMSFFKKDKGPEMKQLSFGFYW